MKICLLGDRCGKTSLLHRWMHPHKRIKKESTIAIDMKSFSLSINKRRVVIQAWDCSSDSAYDTLLDKYIFNSSVAIVCFDLTRMDSWLKAQYWIKRCHEKRIYIIGTMLDRESEREVKEYTVKQYLKKHTFSLYNEVSAFTGENCRDCLQMILLESMRNVEVYTVKDFEDESSCFVM